MGLFRDKRDKRKARRKAKKEAQQIKDKNKIVDSSKTTKTSPTLTTTPKSNTRKGVSGITRKSLKGGPTGKFKKLSNRDTITNTYPLIKERGESNVAFIRRLRNVYLKGGGTTRHIGGPSDLHVNPINRLSNIIKSKLSTAKRETIKNKFSNLVAPETFGQVVKLAAKEERNSFGYDETSFRFVIEFEETGNRYISEVLKRDLDSANSNGNPYFESWVIPTIRLSKKRLNDFAKQFNRFENRWGFTIYDTLGSEAGQEGEIEIVRYVDSLLKRDPVGVDNKFQVPYKKGTVISSHWFSQNKEGIANSEDSANDNSQLNQTRQTEGTTVVTSDDGKDVTVVGDTADLTLGEVANISSDLGFGVGTDDTTTGTTMVVDIDDDGTADSVLNLNDDPNFETFFDPFGNVVGNDDSFGAAAILGSGLSSNLNNLQQDVMNYNNQNNNQNTTQPQATNSNFAPFGEPGEYSYQTRMFNGTEYIWNRMMSGKWETTFSGFGGFGNVNPFGGITF